MISRYNNQQVLFGVLCALGGLCGYAVAYLFFRYVPIFGARSFGFHPPAWVFEVVPLVILGLLSLSGYRIWRRQGGFSSYRESSLYHHLEPSSGGAFMADVYAHRITGPAYVLSQIFLSGPLLALRAVSHFKNRIAVEPGLEESLAVALTNLRAANKWQGLHEHPNARNEILLLAKMGIIDFSAAKGEIRFKASAV